MKKSDLRLERERRRREENKKYILKAAEKVFARKGFSLATVDEIAEEVQFSKATLYRYFKSKREIFIEIIMKTFEEVHKKMTKILHEEKSAEEKLRELIFYMGSSFYKMKNLGRILIIEKSAMKKILNINREEQASHSLHHPIIPKEFKTRIEQIFNIICDIINEGIKLGEFRKVDAREASYVLGAMIRGFYFRGPVRNKEYSLSESTDLLLSFFLHGIKKNGKAL